MLPLDELISTYYPELKGIHPAANLFPLIEGAEFDALVQDIRETGLKYPLDVTPDGLLLDGRNRLRACFLADQEIRLFTVHGDPIRAVISTNIHRRHLEKGQIAIIGARARSLYDEQAKARQVEAVKRGNVTRHQESPVEEKIPQLVERAPQSRDLAAAAVGTNGRYIDKATAILKHAPELAEKVERGEMKLEPAYQAAKRAAPVVEKPAPVVERETTPVVAHTGEIKLIPKPAKPVFNKTGSSVDWAAWTWNPVTGCLHGCDFCYARAIVHNPQMSEAFPFAFEPALYEHRLAAPKNTSYPNSEREQDNRVFVGSMTDLFGKWVPDEWIAKVFAACMEAPEWEYLFLTKWPKRYSMLATLPKAWFGASVIKQLDVARVERDMTAFETTGIKWVSLEPMLEPIVFNDLSWCDLMVIGSQTGTSQPSGWVPPKAAHFEWVAAVVKQCRDAGVPVYLKPNLDRDPGMAMPRELPRR